MSRSSDDGGLTLSSRLTVLSKIAFPVIWIAAFGFGTVAPWSSNGLPTQMKWLFLAIWLVGSSLIVWLCVPLKRVRVQGSTLLISNYRREIAVPLALIDRVTECRWVSVHPVTIYFRTPTDFGDRISFMPKAGMAFHWTSHPVVGELSRMAEAAKGGQV